MLKLNAAIVKRELLFQDGSEQHAKIESIVHLHKPRKGYKITITVMNRTLQFASMKAVAAAFNIDYNRLMKRLGKGWSMEKSLFTSKGNQGPKPRTQSNRPPLDDLIKDLLP